MIGFSFVSLFCCTYAISQILIYWLLIFRINHTFKSTKYALTKCRYIFLTTMVIAYFMLSILMIAYNYLVVFESTKMPKDVMIDCGLIFTFGIEIIDFLFYQTIIECDSGYY